MTRVLLGATLASLLAGCATNVNQVRLDANSVVGVQSPVANACAWRLKDVVDARVAGAEAGGLSANQLKVEDGPALLRAELLKAGLLPADAQGRDVIVRLKQMYMAQNRITKVPVVVYMVEAEGMSPFVVRAQPARMNWNGTQNELLTGLSMAVHEANTQLMASLNKSCSA